MFKKILTVTLLAAMLAACDQREAQKTDPAPVEHTTINNPPAQNTTIVNPPASPAQNNTTIIHDKTVVHDAPPAATAPPATAAPVAPVRNITINNNNNPSASPTP